MSDGDEDYSSRSSLSITHDTVSDTDIEAYYRHRKRIAARKATPEMDQQTQRIQELTQDLHDTVEQLHSMEGNINSWVTASAAREAREAAQAGRLKDLELIQAERAAWPHYLAMSSWDVPGPRGYTALMLAAANDHTECVVFLLGVGADPNCCEPDGHTALHLATNPDIAAILLKYGSNPAAINHLEQTPYEMHASKRFTRLHDESQGGSSGALTKQHAVHKVRRPSVALSLARALAARA